MKRFWYWLRPNKLRRRKIKMWFRIMWYGIVDDASLPPYHRVFGFKVRFHPFWVKR